MKVFVAQFYVEPGVEYLFSHHCQRLLSAEISKRVIPSDEFCGKYGEDYSVIFRMSAKSGIPESVVRGPNVFRRDKEVEFTIFLTFDKNDSNGPTDYRKVLREFLRQVATVFDRLKIESHQLSEESVQIIEMVVNDPEMFCAT
ncbi:MAG: hypothetical protein NT069_00065 [Planctomycetota bacterium]|nr:hypothetical protein [Planctomycetota bacterium]